MFDYPKMSKRERGIRFLGNKSAEPPLPSGIPNLCDYDILDFDTHAPYDLIRAIVVERLKNLEPLMCEVLGEYSTLINALSMLRGEERSELSHFMEEVVELKSELSEKFPRESHVQDEGFDVLFTLIKLIRSETDLDAGVKRHFSKLTCERKG